MDKEKVLKAVADWINKVEQYNLYGSMILRAQGGPVESIGFQINYREKKGGDNTEPNIEFIVDNNLTKRP